jgi:HEAT repeat protein
VKSIKQNDHLAVWTETAVLVAAYAVAIWYSTAYFSRHIALSWLALAIGFCAVQCLVVVSLLGWLMIRKQWFLWLKVRSQKYYPLIQQHLAVVALGTEATAASQLDSSSPTTTFDADGLRKKEFMMEVRSIRDRLGASAIENETIEDLRALQQRYPLEFESCFIRFLPSMTGVGNTRLSQVAERLGLVAKWSRRYQSWHAETRRQAIQRLSQISSVEASKVLLTALEDPEVLIRIDAARGLVQSGGQVEREHLFALLTTQPLIVRSMLVVDLMPYAHDLSERAIPQALASDDPQTIVATLQILESWGRMLPLKDFSRLLEHELDAIRAGAYDALPFVDTEKESLDVIHWVGKGLTDANSEVRRAAARAAGRMSLSGVLEALQEVLHDENAGVSAAAAFSLAQLPDGPEALEKAVVTAPPAIAAASLEALEKLHMGRLYFG